MAYIDNSSTAVGPSSEVQAPTLGQPSGRLLEWIGAPNIAPFIDESKLGEIGHRAKHEYEIDLRSCDAWREKAKKAMDLAMQIVTPKNSPWPGASNVIFPLLTTASIQFAARAYPAIVSSRRVVKGVVIGPDGGQPLTDPQSGEPIVNPLTGQPVWIRRPGEKQERAERIGGHMSWQLLSEQPEWESETDALLHILPIVGCAFRKSYYDPARRRNMSLLVPATSLVINYFAKSCESAPRLTEEFQLYPREIEENERAGVFVEHEYGQAAPPASLRTGHNLMRGVEGQGASEDSDAPHDFIEQHRWLDLDEDGYVEPYIVTVHMQTSRVVRIVARFEPSGIVTDPSGRILRIEPVHYYTKYDFLPNPEGGLYGIGFGHLLRPINEAVNSSINMMIDAGHLQVAGGGFIGKGLSLHTGRLLFKPGEWKVVNVAGGSLRDSVVPLEAPGPSAALFQLLGSLIEAGRDVSAVKDVLTGDQPQANVPATTTLALIEQGLKVFTAIYKRIHRSLKSEFEKLYRLNALYMPEQAAFQTGDEWHTVTREDYAERSGVEPVSDPAIVTDMQRMAKAQYLLQFANDPLFNPFEIRKRVLEAGQIERPEMLLNPEPPQNLEAVIEGMKLEIAAKRNSAAEVKDLAVAIHQLAVADKAMAEAGSTLAESNLGWLRHQLEVLKLRFEGAQTDLAAAQGAGVPQPGDDGGRPTGLPPEARQAPDGNWYVPDPKRPGKFLKLLPNAETEPTGAQAHPASMPSSEGQMMAADTSMGDGM